MKFKKLCLLCGNLKKIDEFSVGTKDGKPNRNAYCKSCMVKRMNIWRKKNLEKYNKYQRDCLKRNKNRK